MRIYKFLFALVCCVLTLGATMTTTQAARLKDLASVQGVRSNQLIGYGLVAGLAGTGESNSDFTEQTFRSMLNNFGIKVPDNVTLKISDVAPVVVHAELPPFAKPGQQVDITVSAIGEAESLRGGAYPVLTARASWSTPQPSVVSRMVPRSSVRFQLTST